MIGGLSVLIDSEVASTSLCSSLFHKFKLSTLVDTSEIIRCRFACSTCKARRKVDQPAGQDWHNGHEQAA